MVFYCGLNISLLEFYGFLFFPFYWPFEYLLVLKARGEAPPKAEFISRLLLDPRL